MNQAFAAHAIADPCFVEQIHGALFENAGADPLLHVFAALRLDDDRVDALDLEQMGKKEAGRPRPDDADLGAEFPGSRHELTLHQMSCKFKPVSVWKVAPMTAGSDLYEFFPQAW
jgi:hypothetical protein